MPLVGGSVSIKNSCQKSREAGGWRAGRMGNQREEEREDKVEDSGLLYETIHPSCSSTVPRWPAGPHSHM